MEDMKLAAPANRARQRACRTALADTSTMFCGDRSFEAPSRAGEHHKVNFLFWRRLVSIIYQGMDSYAWATLVLLCAISAGVAYIQATLLPTIGAPIGINTLAYLGINQANFPPGLLPVLQRGLCSSLGVSDAPLLRMQNECLKESIFGLRGFAGIQAQQVEGSFGNIGTAYTYLGWTSVMVLSTTIVLTFGTMLSIRVRYVLTNELHKKMFRRRTHYELCHNYNKMDNYDQRLTDDFQLAMEAGLGRITASLFIPTSQALAFGVCISAFSLNTSFKKLEEQQDKGGLESWVQPAFIGTALGALVISLVVYIPLVNKVALLLFNQSYLEGELRWLHSRIVNNCESISAMRGEQCEEAESGRRFSQVYTNTARLAVLLSVLCGFREFFNTLSTALAYLFLYLGNFDVSVLFVLQTVFNAGFTAIVNIPMQYQQLAVAAGPTHRIGELSEALTKITEKQDLRANEESSAERRRLYWKRKLLRLKLSRGQAAKSTLTEDSDPHGSKGYGSISQQSDALVLTDKDGPKLLHTMQQYTSLIDSSSINNINDDLIILDHVKASPPAVPSLVLFEDISLTIRSGDGGVCIMGPSGCGKSSLLRVIGGLWEPASGEVLRSDDVGRDGIMFVPQRSYTLANATLRSQLMYPSRSCYTGDDEQTFVFILGFAGLGEVLDKFGLDTVRDDWGSQLSAGEMQCLGLARVLYHKPKFALMDESTSALDPLTEARLLSASAASFCTQSWPALLTDLFHSLKTLHMWFAQECNRLGVTLIGVCHKMSAVGFHGRVLKYTAPTVGDPTSWRIEKVDLSDKSAADVATSRALADHEKRNKRSASSILKKSKKRATVGRCTANSEVSISIGGEDDSKNADTGGEEGDEGASSNDGLNAVFWRRFSFMVRLSLTPMGRERQGYMSSKPFWVLVGLFLANCGFAAVVVGGCRVAGNMLNNLIKYSYATKISGQVSNLNDSIVDGLIVLFLLSIAAFATRTCSSLFGQIIALHMRRSLMEEAQVAYFSKSVAYHMNKLDEESGIKSIDAPDQRIQQDLQRLSRFLSDSLFGGAYQPGIFGSVTQLFCVLGYGLTLSWLVSVMLLGLVIIAIVGTVAIGGPAARSFAEVQRREGRLRKAHARLREFSESIAFYGGAKAEAEDCAKVLDELYEAMLWSVFCSFPVCALMATMAILLGTSPTVLMSVAVFYGGSVDDISFSDYTSGLTLFLAFGIQLVYFFTSLGTIPVLVGLTHRVGALLESCRDVEWRVHEGRTRSRRTRAKSMDGASPETMELVSGVLELSNVTVAWPSSDTNAGTHKKVHDDCVLLRNLTVSVYGEGEEAIASDDQGERVTAPPRRGLLISGPSSSGKSSLLRVIGGLWDPVEGTVARRRGKLNQERNAALEASPGYSSATPSSHSSWESYSSGSYTPMDREESVGNVFVRRIGFTTKNNRQDALKDGHVESANDDEEERPVTFHIPQTAYLPVGTLRQQVVYPIHSPPSKVTRDGVAIPWQQADPRPPSFHFSAIDRMGRSLSRHLFGISTEDLIQHAEDEADDLRILSILDLVGLGYLAHNAARKGKMVPTGEGRTMRSARRGLDHVARWEQQLSGGEAQRLMIARVLYHAPIFALLDEGTSALDVALEERCMKAILRSNVTPISISHRPNVEKFHAKKLELFGQGSKEFRITDTQSTRTPENSLDADTLAAA